MNNYTPNHMRTLISLLQKAQDAYDKGNPIMTDTEWDQKYFELKEAEEATGLIYPDSPTQEVSYCLVNALTKVKHNHPMLSLDKTKDFDEFKKYFNNQTCVLMPKLDGLTCSLLYQKGKLVRAETRGNGVEGEDVTHNAMVISSIPKSIPTDRDEIIIDGEIICKAEDFKEFESLYANQRNFASGSIRLLDSKICSKRKLTFIAWNYIKGFNSSITSFSERMRELATFGFNTVPTEVSNYIVESDIKIIRDNAIFNGLPLDGIVGRFDDVEYGESLGVTSHHSKAAFAYKFYDEEMTTHLIDIEWSIGRTGVLTPVAIFESIELEGSVVSRASLHNLSIMKETLGLPYVGQEISVIKANQIIPQIVSACKDVPAGAETLVMPFTCPACGSPDLGIVESENAEFLVCGNPMCEGKLVNRLDHFCSKKAGLNIKGLSRKTLEKLIDWGWLENLSDIYTLKEHREEWIDQPGFGEKSVDNILEAIESSKDTTLTTFISSLGIPLIGPSVAKDLTKVITSYEDLKEKIKEHFDFSQLDGFAESKSKSLVNFDFTEADKIYAFLNISNEVSTPSGASLQNMQIAITGKLKNYKNRESLKIDIENNGGKVVDSVTKKTTILINNDTTSNSAKNLSAKKLNIPIMTEEDFVKKFLTF